jgi:hypothetical protein
MFQRACRYDDDTVFYFTHDGFKWVAVGGSLAWRLMNPGLIPSRSPIPKRHGSIGTNNDLAIFSNPKNGHLALKAWLRTKNFYEVFDYYNNQIAIHCDYPLAQLSVPIDKNGPKLTSNEVEKIAGMIQKIVGFNDENRGDLSPLPQITERYYFESHQIELYLIGDNLLVTKHEAISLVNQHRLDAVIVHQGDDQIYLRSRPGHCSQEIHLKKDPESYAFNEAVREEGEYNEGQCIWGFVNGILNGEQGAKGSAKLISGYAEGERVWLLNNDAMISNFGNLGSAFSQKTGLISTEAIPRAIHYLRLLLSVSQKAGNCVPVVIFAHSQGAMIVNQALNGLSAQEQELIRVFTFGGAEFIPVGKAHADSHNFIATKDTTVRGVSLNFVPLFLRLWNERKSGFNDQQIISQWIDEDIIFYIDSETQDTIHIFEETRRQFYETIVVRAANITVLQSPFTEIFGHLFSSTSYQKKVKELVEKYRDLNLQQKAIKEQSLALAHSH